MRRKRNSRLARKKYCEYHGLKRIPKGHHVHHRNKKYWDNSKENLILLTAEEHLSFHAKQRMRTRGTQLYSSDQMAKYHGLKIK